MKRQLTELLTGYGSVGAVCEGEMLEGILCQLPVK